MNDDTLTFDNRETQMLWAGYLDKVEQLARPLAKPQRRDMLAEIRAHLLESMLGDEGDEAQRLSEAIRRLGKPEEFVPVWVAERLAQGADPSLMVRSRWQLLRLEAADGVGGLVQGLARSLVLGFGYMLMFYTFFMFVMKLVFPDKVGLFVLPNGVPFIGYADTATATEILGWWFLPASLLFSLAMFWLLSRRGSTHSG